MNIDNIFVNFINEHSECDVYDLLLKADKYRGIDIQLAATSISTRKKIIAKVPDWEKTNGLFFPKKITAEQASSQKTAQYKQRFCNNGPVFDLTGGYGIDSYFLAQKATTHYYFESDKDVYESTIHNFSKLGLNNIIFHNCIVEKGILQNMNLPQASLIYIDPARRGGGSKRLYAITDYSPDLLTLKDDLFQYSDKILIKVSPMVDITASLKLLPEIAEVHVLSVNNECKELLFLLSKEKLGSVGIDKSTKIFTTNFSKEEIDSYSFSLDEESSSIPFYSDELADKFLYEPCSSILKAGAFISLGTRYCLKKLSKHTHLYTSNKLISEFPGRKFQVIEQLEYKKHNINSLKDKYPKANISTRNFPLTPEGLKRILKISDGGDVYIFGCTVKEKKMIIITEKIY